MNVLIVVDQLENQIGNVLTVNMKHKDIEKDKMFKGTHKVLWKNTKKWK